MTKSEMQGTTVLITGGNSGIGYATAEALARRGAHVALVSRDAARGQAARDRLAAATGNPRIDVLQADLAAQAQVRRLAATVQERYSRLDVVINNAGGFEPHRRLSPDGIEMTVAVNLVAPWLLTELLADRLRASAPARVVNVASGAADRATLDLDDLQYERRRYRAFGAYGQSKLALILISNEQARRFAGSGVTVNSLHPGFVATNFGRRDPLTSLGWLVMRPFQIDAVAGAQTTLHVATDPGLATVSGRYFSKQQPVSPNPIAEDAALAQRLWQMLETLTGATGPAPAKGARSGGRAM